MAIGPQCGRGGDCDFSRRKVRIPCFGLAENMRIGLGPLAAVSLELSVL